eukprot:gene8227-biopygen10087
MEAMQQKISEALEAQSVSVTDVYGDGRHVNIAVVSNAFEGKNSVQRQRMVYKVQTRCWGGVTAATAQQQLTWACHMPSGLSCKMQFMQ